MAAPWAVFPFNLRCLGASKHSSRLSWPAFMFSLSSVSHCSCLQAFSEGLGWHGKRRCMWRWRCLFLLEVTLFYSSLFNFFFLNLALRIGTPPKSVRLTAFVLGFVRFSTVCSGKTCVVCSKLCAGKGLESAGAFQKKVEVLLRLWNLCKSIEFWAFLW